MRKKLKVVMLVGLLVIAFSVTAPSLAIGGKPAPPTDWLEEISKHMDADYVQGVVEDLVAMGSSDLGFRSAGTKVDDQQVRYIMSEMRKIGLEGVDKEAVPVDSWEFRSASLKVNSPVKMEVIASSFAGVQGTGPKGISGELIYVGSSYKSDYDGLDVEGKIVLSNWDGYNLWIDAIGMMAYLRGAKGIVVSCMDSIYGQGPYALQCHDSNWDPEWAPMIYIPKEYGYQLVDMLESGMTVSVTMKSDIKIVMGDVGYNTIGYIPGKNYGTPDDTLIVVGDHHDAWFTGAGDDTSGTAVTLGVAKAMIDAGYQPESTMVFTTRTAEEYGTVNVYFDWCVGAWYQITREHPEWVGKTIANINFEAMGIKMAPFGIETPIDLFPFIQNVLSKVRPSMPYGISAYPEISTWNDQWTFNAEGVPAITTSTWVYSGEYSEENIYHTQLDNVDILDYAYLGGPCMYANLAIIVGLDQEPIIPYNLNARANNFLNLWNAGEVKSTGVDASLVDAVTSAAMEFKSLAQQWEMAKRNVDPAMIDYVNERLLQAVSIISDELTAMDVWEISVYPHQQPLTDCIWLDKAYDVLRESDVDTGRSAQIFLMSWVGTVWYYLYVDYEYYWNDAVSLHSPDNWGEQVQLGEIVDTWDVVESLEYKWINKIADFDAERIRLMEEKQVALGNLEDALYVTLNAFTEANALIAQIV